MGINSCSRGNILWKATGLTLHSLKSFGFGNKIDVDGNLLFYQIQGSGGKSIELIVREMAASLKQIAHSGGFVVTVVMDGNARPDCKRASWERRKDDSLIKTNRMYCRLKMLEMSSRLENEAMNEEKRNEIKNQLHLYNEATKSLEKKCNRLGMSTRFCDLLLQRLSFTKAFQMNENGGFVSPKIIKAKFQADYVIALRSLEKKNDFIYSSDSDFAGLLGNDCVLIDKVQNTGGRLLKKKNSKKEKKNAKENKKKEILLDATSFAVTLSGVINRRMSELRQRLEQREKNSKVIWTRAKLPLFEDKPQRLRALIALTLGCDVFQGIKQCGPTMIKNILEKINNEKDPSESMITSAFESFLERRLRNNERKNSDATSIKCLINILVESFLCEPGVVAEEIELHKDESKKNSGCNDSDEENEIGNTEGRKEESEVESDDDIEVNNHHQLIDANVSTGEGRCHLYVTDEKPPSLGEYVKTFSTCESIEIREDGAELGFCKGTSATRSHFFPKYEGSWECHLCHAHFCRTCAYVPQIDNEKKKKIFYADGCEYPFCIDCFKYHRLGNDHQNNGTNELTESEMSKELNEKFGVQFDRTASVTETMDIYDTYVSSPDNMHDHHLSLVRKVKYPLFPSNILDDYNDNEGDCPIMKTGKRFKFKNGGRFISDKSIVSDEEIPDILDLFASFLEVDPSKHAHTNVSDIGPFGYLPNMILNLAYHSRVDSGFRLIKRCVRHTFNTITLPIIDTTAEVFRINSNGE